MAHHKSKMRSSSTDSVTMKNCSFCFSEFKEENGTSKHSLKLYRTCCKYLHSSLTQESLSSKTKNTRSLSFCPQCVESAEKLMGFTDQREFFDKRISELIFIFSVDILHRRGKVSDVDIQNNITYHPYRKKLVEVDVGTLPLNSDSCDDSTFNFDVPPSEESQNISEDISESLNNNGLSTTEDPVQVIIEGTLRFEGDLNNWIDESIDIKFPIREETTVENLPKENLVPVLKLQRLHFGIDSMGTEIINTECDTNKAIDCNQREERISPTTATSDFKNSFNEVPIKQEYETFDESSDTGMGHETSTELSIPIITAKTSSRDHVNKGRESEKPQSQMDEGDCLLKPSKKKDYKCDVCKKMFGMKANLANHVRVHDINRPYCCDVCGYRFTYNESLLIHEKTHTNAIHYKCDVCSKEFLNGKFLALHKEKTHTKPKKPKPIRVTGDDKPLKCSKCGKKFKTKLWLKRHLAAIHNIEAPKKQFKCEKCDYVTDCPSNLKIHEKDTHRDGNSFQCRECEKEFKIAIVAEEHYKIDHSALDFTNDCIIIKDESLIS